MSTTAALARHRTHAPVPARPEGAMRTSPTTSRVIALRRPAVVPLLQALAAKWLDWRTAVRQRREERLLAALPRHVLRDVGLAHLADESPRLPWPDMDRVRW